MIKFGICSDLHHDLIPDGAKRLDGFINAMKSNNVDFVIHLGDFCFANTKNQEVINKWYTIKNSYQVLGNHDMDHNTKQQAVDFFKMKNAYYSFNNNGLHFIVLDPNNLKLCDGYEDYSFGNYFSHADKINYIDQKQLNWLESDLNSTNLPCVIFSHQNLAPDEYGINNNQQLAQVILKCGGNKKVVACFNGHDHVDGVKQINGIWYITINSMSFFYMSSDINIMRYSQAITEKYPILRQACPYEAELFTTVEINNEYIKIKPSISSFVGASPTESGHSGELHGFKSTPLIQAKKLKLNAK